MNKTVSEYSDEITELSKSVLLEFITLLKGYSKSIVLVGGWVPYFLLKKFQKNTDFVHVGSADIDFVIDPKLIKTCAYETIVEIIEKNGYEQRKDKHANPIEFSFTRNIKGKSVNIDFLSIEYSEKKLKRHRAVQQDLRARTLKGAKIVLNHNSEEEIEGVLPNRAEVKAKLKVADIVGSMATKALALGGRSEAKDNYDIYALISHYKKGESSCAKAIKPYLTNKDIRESMEEIKKNFEKEMSLGPTLVGNFMFPNDADARKRIMTDSFMRVNRFLNLLK